MDLTKELINLEIYERSGLFKYISSYEMQRYSMTVEIDITPIFKYCKKYGNLNACMVYAFVNACNNVEEFRMRIENGKLYKHKFVHAGVYFSTQNKQFRQGVINIDQMLDNFIEDYQKLKEECWQTGKIIQNGFGQGIIETSCVKWYNFIGLCEIAKSRDDSIPSLTCDKVYKDGFKRKVHLAITMNHSIVDGYHIGLLIEAIKKEVEKFKSKR